MSEEEEKKVVLVPTPVEFPVFKYKCPYCGADNRTFFGDKLTEDMPEFEHPCLDCGKVVILRAQPTGKSVKPFRWGYTTPKMKEVEEMDIPEDLPEEP